MSSCASWQALSARLACQPDASCVPGWPARWSLPPANRFDRRHAGYLPPALPSLCSAHIVCLLCPAGLQVCRTKPILPRILRRWPAFQRRPPGTMMHIRGELCVGACHSHQPLTCHPSMHPHPSPLLPLPTSSPEQPNSTAIGPPTCSAGRCRPARHPHLLRHLRHPPRRRRPARRTHRPARPAPLGLPFLTAATMRLGAIPGQVPPAPTAWPSCPLTFHMFICHSCSQVSGYRMVLDDTWLLSGM